MIATNGDHRLGGKDWDDIIVNHMAEEFDRRHGENPLLDLQSYQDLQNQYRAGTATSVDVLSALNDFNAARRDLAVQTYVYQVALRNLEQVAGVFQETRVDRVKLP